MFLKHEESKLQDHLLDKGFESAVMSILNDDAAASSMSMKDVRLDMLLMMNTAEVMDAEQRHVPDCQSCRSVAEGGMLLQGI